MPNLQFTKPRHGVPREQIHGYREVMELSVRSKQTFT